jgi:hypothetical protein
MEKIKKVGRPRTEDYRKKRFRFSRVEDTLKPILEKMESEKDRKLLEEGLRNLRSR